MLTNSLLYYFFLVYLARSKRPNTPHFVLKSIVRNFEVREICIGLNGDFRYTNLIRFRNTNLCHVTIMRMSVTKASQMQLQK